MKKKSFLLMCMLAAVTGKSFAQQLHCGTDEHRKQLIALHPEILKYEADLEKQIAQNLRKIELSKYGKSTASVDTMWYDIPVVVHIVHDYGAEYLTDNDIFEALANWNIVYAKQNSDTASVIAPFKKYIGNPRIRLHLATVDPNGVATKGITRKRSYLTKNGGDQAKFDDWDPTAYLNIWVINHMSGLHAEAAAYATPPSSGAVQPYRDGVISLYDYMDRDKTINHEIGHVFNLAHTWGNNNNAAAGTCADGGTDYVDDTPPTIGHMTTGCTAAALYDTVCATNYYKVYTRTTTGAYDSLVDYPDTVNAQNVMDYTYCSRMFTIGQCERMHAALNSTTAGRNNLWKPANLVRTGVMDASMQYISRPDLKPIPDFYATYSAKMQYFTCPGTALNFINKSWNDTVTKVRYTFSNGANHPDTTLNNPGYSTSIPISFTQEGWVTISMTATGNHTSSPTTPWSTTDTWNSVYVASNTATSGNDYYQDFNPAGDMDKWPLFNYYGNEFKWEKSFLGYVDGYGLKYTGYDSRINTSYGISPNTGSPFGDIDDFFSTPMDLTGFGTGACNLNFYTTGASRSSNSLEITDTFEVAYSADRGKTWTKISTLAKGTLANMGAVSTPYVPTSVNDWLPHTIALPAAARTNYTVFRFRYRPGVDRAYQEYSTGNNFYIDRINFSKYPAAVNAVAANTNTVTVVPNPTNNNAVVIINNSDNKEAKVVVSDITGKVVFTTTQVVSTNDNRIEIPASALSVKGIFMVQVTAGSEVSTQKLVVY